MDNPIVVMNFSHVYEMESFYEKNSIEWMDLTKVQGTNCYCDEFAERKIKRALKPFGAESIHFIDSGNYHYLSKYWLDKVMEPFVLIVFDHHPDMQPTLFEGFMSCGCWVKKTLDENPFIQKVIILGAKDELLEKIEPAYKDRVIGYSESDLNLKEKWKDFSELSIHFPVYISVDKDVLCPKYAVTNWDQGSLSLLELERLLHIILEHNTVLGVDICGENAQCQNGSFLGNDLKVNDSTNEELLHFLKQYFG